MPKNELDPNGKDKDRGLGGSRRRSKGPFVLAWGRAQATSALGQADPALEAAYQKTNALHVLEQMDAEIQRFPHRGAALDGFIAEQFRLQQMVASAGDAEMAQAEAQALAAIARMREHVDRHTDALARLHQFRSSMLSVQAELDKLAATGAGGAQDRSADRERRRLHRAGRVADTSAAGRLQDEGYAMLTKAAAMAGQAEAMIERAGELDAPTQALLDDAQLKLKAVSTGLMIDLRASMMERKLKLEARARDEPGSDAGRLQAVLGPQGLSSYISGMFAVEQLAGLDMRSLGQPALTDEEALGVYAYTTDDYKQMNWLLLFGDDWGRAFKAAKKDPPTPRDRAKFELFNELCARGLAKLPDYPANLYPVIRHEQGNFAWEKVYKVGKTFRNKQFWSTGATAGQDTDQYEEVRLIHRIYGRSGKDVAALSAMRGEGAKKDFAVTQLAALGKGEILFAPGTTFEVLAISRRPKVGKLEEVDITLREVARGGN